MTPETLGQIGKALFGTRWKTPLARAIGVQRETVSRWSTGKQPIPKTASLAIMAKHQQRGKVNYKERRFKAQGDIKQVGQAK